MTDLRITREDVHWMHADAVARIGREVGDAIGAHISAYLTDPVTGEIDGGDLHLLSAGVLGVLLDEFLRFVRPEDERAWVDGLFQYAPRTLALLQHVSEEPVQ